MVNAQAAAWQEWYKGKMCNSDSCPTDATLRTYGYSMNWLQTRMEGFDVEKELVPESEAILEYMDENKVTTNRRIQSFTAMKVFHRCMGQSAKSKKYCTPLVTCKRQQDAEYNKQRRTAHQSKNWVEFKVLKKFAAGLRKKVFALNKNEIWDKEAFADAQLACILQYHLTFPIRLDLCTVQWGVEPSEDYNYVDMKSQSIVYHKHKLSRWRKEPFTHQLSRPMWRLLRLLIKQQKLRDHTSGMVLLNRYGRKMTKNGYSSWFKREMKKCPGCECKEVGCLILRHSVITHKRGGCMTIEKRGKFADQCMHSVGCNEQYRVHA